MKKIITRADKLLTGPANCEDRISDTGEEPVLSPPPSQVMTLSDSLRVQVSFAVPHEAESCFEIAAENEELIWLFRRHDALAVAPSRILFVEAADHTVTVVLSDQVLEGVRSSLYALLHRLQCLGMPRFQRSHKSYVINLERIRAIRMLDRRLWEVFFDCPAARPCYLSQTYYKNVTGTLWEEPDQ